MRVWGRPVTVRRLLREIARREAINHPHPQHRKAFNHHQPTTRGNAFNRYHPHRMEKASITTSLHMETRSIAITSRKHISIDARIKVGVSKRECVGWMAIEAPLHVLCWWVIGRLSPHVIFSPTVTVITHQRYIRKRYAGAPSRPTFAKLT